MTARELEDWRDSGLAAEGFEVIDPFGVDVPRRGAVPLVEVKRTYEDEIPAGAVRWQLGWVEDERGRRTLFVTVRSTWDRVVPCFYPSLDFENETPQPEPGASRAWDVTGAGAADAAAFRRVPEGTGADLWPGQPAVFVLDPDYLESLRSRAAALSPERHRIALRTDGRLFDFIPGSAVASFLETDPAA